MTFSDRTAFETATGATVVGQFPKDINSVSFILGGLTFSQESPSSFNTSRDWSTLISEPFDLAINNVESFNVVSATDIFSFGFDFHEPSLGPTWSVLTDTCAVPVCTDSTFRVSLLDGAVAVGTFDFNRPDDSPEFVGVWSTEKFNRIEIRDLTNTIDDEFFGNFSTGDNKTTPIPEPSIIVLFVVGLLGLSFARRKIRR